MRKDDRTPKETMDDLGQQLSNKQWKEFLHCVRKAGINTDTWWEAIEYTGPSKVLNLELFIRRGCFSRSQIAAGNDYESLQTMTYYIKNNPECRNWKLYIGTGQWCIQHGHFVIVEKNSWRGGDRQAVVDLLRSFGIDHDLIESTLNERTERVLGYILSSNIEEASRLAEIVQIGAMSPDFVGDARFVQWIKEKAKTFPN